jgi:hypothetical protein
MRFSTKKRNVKTGKFFVGFSSFNGIIGEGFGGQYDSIELRHNDNNRFTILLKLKQEKDPANG